MPEKKSSLYVSTTVPVHKWLRVFLRKTCGEQFEALSAGFKPSTLNPVVKLVGIDISGNENQSVGDILTGGESFGHVITVWDVGTS